MPTSKKPLTTQRYAALRDDVVRLVDRTDSAAAGQRVQMYWRMGARIARERLAHNAGYHNSVLRDLSRDTDLALRTLQRALVFHAAYPKRPAANTPLRWSHYILLLALPAELRAHYARLAIERHLAARELAALIQVETSRDPNAATQLPRPTSPSYLYAGSVHNIVDADTLDLQLDLGFHISHLQRIRLAALDAPDLATPQGRAARDFVAFRLLPAQTVVVQTRKYDIHGRYVGHVFYSPRKIGIDACFAEGFYLNEELVAGGWARQV